MVSIQSSLMLVAMRKGATGCLGQMGYGTVAVYGGYDKPSWNGIVSYKICFCGSCGQESASRMWEPGSRPLKMCTLCSSSTNNADQIIGHIHHLYLFPVIYL